MRTIRRVGGLAVAGLLLGAVAGGPAASAQSPGGTPASYTGAAAGQALKVSLGAASLTAGSSVAKAGSTGSAEATGIGVLSPAGASGSVTAKNPPGEAKPEVCGATVAPPAPLNILTLGLGCGQASATGTGLETVASASGEVADLDLTLNNLLNGPLKPVTGPLVTTVDSTLNTVCGGIPAGALRDVCTTANNTIDEVVESVVATQTLAADVGASTSAVSLGGAVVTSESTAAAAVIKLLPNPTLDGVTFGEPLATITVSRANAKVACDLGNGTATPTIDPALVRVKLSAPVVALIPALPNLIPGIPGVTLKNGEFTIAPGQSQVLFAGLPIETEIVVAGGVAKVNADGSATAVADGVKIHALRGPGIPAPLAGGLLLNLAHAEAAGACVAAITITETPRAAPEVPQELPRTGGTPWLPIVGAAGLALAVIARRTLVRSN